MKLYDAKQAPNPRRVRMFLAEKRIEVPTQQVDLLAMENRKHPFLTINPLAGVPVLELDDGTHIAETVAICRYFEVMHPTPCLLGDSALGEANIEMWNRRAELALMQPVAAVFQHGHGFFKERIEQVPAYADASRRTVAARLAWFDKALAGREYMAGDKFSIADITAVCAIDFARVVDIRLAEEHPHLRQWHERIAARRSYHA